MVDRRCHQLFDETLSSSWGCKHGIQHDEVPLTNLRLSVSPRRPSPERQTELLHQSTSTLVTEVTTLSRHDCSFDIRPLRDCGDLANCLPPSHFSPPQLYSASTCRDPCCRALWVGWQSACKKRTDHTSVPESVSHNTSTYSPTATMESI